MSLADPQGSSLYHWLRHGELKATGPGSITEGIGIGRVTANLEGSPLDDALHVTDVECVRRFIGCCARKGCSWAAPAASTSPAAVQIAQRLGPGHTIVTILCDNGAKYQSRLFNRKWLAEKGFLDAAGFTQRVQSAPIVRRLLVSLTATHNDSALKFERPAIHTDAVIVGAGRAVCSRCSSLGCWASRRMSSIR